MKSTGIIREVDELGRIVIPIEIRRNLGIEEKDSLRITLEGENIVLRKDSNRCIFCGAAENLTLFEGKAVCPECIRQLKLEIE